jgi:hypothetical protein
VDQAAPFSGVSVILEIVEDMTAALRRIEDSRAISAAESRQLDTLELLRDGLRLALPRATSAAFMGSVAAPLIELLSQAHDATAAGIAIPDLLDMRAAVPRGGPHWHPLQLSIESLTWCGVTRTVDDLRLICQVGVSSIERQQQLDCMRELQSALATVIDLDATHRRFHRANARVQAGMADAAKSITDQLPAIRAEAAAIRARRR